MTTTDTPAAAQNPLPDSEATPATTGGRLSVIVPAYDEVDLLPTTLARLLVAPALGWTKQILVVDDGSTDGTREWLRDLRDGWPYSLVRVAEALRLDGAREAVARTELRVLFHTTNRGKGAAIRTALEHVAGDLTLVQDADLEYDPSELKRLMEPIVSGRADVVFGSRFLGQDARRVLYFRHALGNWLLTGISNLLTDLNLTDMETGYKAFRTDLLRSIHLVSDRFGFEPEIVAKVAKMHARVYEVPVSYAGRTYEEGKKVTWRDAVAALWHLFYFNVLPVTYCRDAGHETLRNLGAITRFNQFMYDALAPYLGQRVLEVGAGIGNLTTFLARGRYVAATDLEPHYVAQLLERFRDRVRVQIGSWDISRPVQQARWFGRSAPAGAHLRVEALVEAFLREGDGAAPAPAGGEAPPAGGGAAGPGGATAGAPFDTVVCLNVLEHVEDDLGALRNVRGALTTDGTLVLLVPAFPSLFCDLDVEVGHYRRYSRSQLEAVLRRAGFRVERIFPFNAWGLLGWWLNGTVLRRKRLPGEQLSLFGRVAPLLVALERLLKPPFGLSHIAIAHPQPSGAAEAE